MSRVCKLVECDVLLKKDQKNFCCMEHYRTYRKRHETEYLFGKKSKMYHDYTAIDIQMEDDLEDDLRKVR